MSQLQILRYPDPRLYTVAKPVAEVDEHRDRRVRHEPEVEAVRLVSAEAGHPDPRQPARPGRGRDLPPGRTVTSGLSRSHAVMLRRAINVTYVQTESPRPWRGH